MKRVSKVGHVLPWTHLASTVEVMKCLLVAAATTITAIRQPLAAAHRTPLVAHTFLHSFLVAVE